VPRGARRPAARRAARRVRQPLHAAHPRGPAREHRGALPEGFTAKLQLQNAGAVLNPARKVLYDKIAKPTDKTVATQASRQPISNIKSSIGINEKFIYLKDLFKNNINDYNEALEKLNNFDSYEEAEDFFQDLKQKYGWDPDSKSFQGLADLLSRRYLHNASS
jgi:hypothetical protein